MHALISPYVFIVLSGIYSGVMLISLLRKSHDGMPFSFLAAVVGVLATIAAAVVIGATSKMEASFVAFPILLVSWCLWVVAGIKGERRATEPFRK
ncbi:MAG: hypothetical protein ACP5O6_03050 [Candidatus Baltobacteraceae bacterium]